MRTSLIVDPPNGRMPPLTPAAEQRAEARRASFKRWDTIFPNASCAVALIDRLTHHAEILAIEGDSYRRRDAELSQKQRRNKAKRR